MKGIEVEHGENQSYDLGQVSPSIHCKLLANTLLQYATKGIGENSIFCSGCSLWVHKKCSDIQVDQLKILILRGFLVMHRQLMEDLVLNPNLLIASLMQLTILHILVIVFVQVEVVSLPLLKDATLHGETLENCCPCILVKLFL